MRPFLLIYSKNIKRCLLYSRHSCRSCLYSGGPNSQVHCQYTPYLSDENKQDNKHVNEWTNKITLGCRWESSENYESHLGRLRVVGAAGVRHRGVLIWRNWIGKSSLMWHLSWDFKGETSLSWLQRLGIKEFHAKGLYGTSLVRLRGEKGGQHEWSTVDVKEPKVRVVQKGRQEETGVW